MKNRFNYHFATRNVNQKFIKFFLSSFKLILELIVIFVKVVVNKNKIMSRRQQFIVA
jgi:hypothetical protein